MFTSIYHVMQEGQALSLHLMRNGGKLSVCFQPLSSNASDAAGSNLTPLVITGTPAELEDGFMTAICMPLEERFGMLANLEEFKKSTQKAQPKAGGTAEGTGIVSVEPATNAVVAKKTKRDEQGEAAEKMAKSGNLPGAYGIYKKLYEQDKGDVKAGNRMHELWAQMSQKPLFPDLPGTAAAEEKPDLQPVMPVAGQPYAIPPLGIGEMAPEAVPQPEGKEPEVDMFARFLNPDKAGNPAREEAVLPGIDPEQYEKFLAFQQFQESQKAFQTV